MMLAGTVLAERADRDQPVNLEADRATVQDANKLATFTGNVVLTQGTLVIRADKMTVKEDASGFQYATAFGNLVSFRQNAMARMSMWRAGANVWNMTARPTRCSYSRKHGCDAGRMRYTGITFPTMHSTNFSGKRERRNKYSSSFRRKSEGGNSARRKNRALRADEIERPNAGK